MCTRAYGYMLILILMCNFSKYWLFINFLGKFHPKISCFPYLLTFSIEIQWAYISQNKKEEASQGCENVLVNEHVFYCFYHFCFADQHILRSCVYVYVFVFGATSKLPVLSTIKISNTFSCHQKHLNTLFSTNKLMI